jgi:hypothetical protein
MRTNKTEVEIREETVGRTWCRFLCFIRVRLWPLATTVSNSNGRSGVVTCGVGTF